MDSFNEQRVRAAFLAGNSVAEVCEWFDAPRKEVIAIRDAVYEDLHRPEYTHQLAAGPCLNPQAVVAYSAKRRPRRKREMVQSSIFDVLGEQ